MNADFATSPTADRLLDLHLETFEDTESEFFKPYVEDLLKLTKTQANAIKAVAAAEMRSEAQVISLLLAEGIRFFYCDDYPRFGNAAEIQQLSTVLETEARALVFTAE